MSFFRGGRRYPSVHGGYDVPASMSVPEETTRDFELLFDSYYGRLARLLYRVAGEPGHAEEIAAEAFWRLHHKPPRDRSNLEGWLYRTGLRLALDQIKRERRRARYEAMAAWFGIAPSPDKALEQTEDQRRVRLTLASIKPEQAALILLRSDDFAYADIAAKLRLNPASVGTLLTRAEHAFRKEYCKRYGNR